MPTETEAIPPPTFTSATFDGHQVRFAATGGQLHIAAADLCRALKLPLSQKITSARYLRHVAEAERGYTSFLTRTGPQRLATVTPEGAVQLTKRRSRRLDQRVRTFVRHEAARLQGLPSPSSSQVNTDNGS